MAFFTKLTSKRICEEILSAKQSVIIAVPGIDKSVAQALIEARQNLPEGVVQVVLDVSANVSRLGYGEFDAVEMLQTAGFEIKQQSGLLLGVLICDNKGWSFVSAPCLVEDEVHEHDEVCNAIAFTEMQVLALRGELPETKKPAGQTSPETPLPIRKAPVIGADPVKKDTVTQVKKALDIAPVQAFDLARQSRVYSSLVQFVELKLEGLNLQARKVSLPKDLSLITTSDEELKKRVSTTLKLLEKIDTPKQLADISEKINELRVSFLAPVGNLGRIIIKNKRNDFEAILAEIKKDLDKCRIETQNLIETGLDKTKQALVADLVRAVLKNPPMQFRGMYQLNNADAERYVIKELDKVFPHAEKLVEGMKISCIYKDVTYDMLKNEDFANKLNDIIPESILDGALLREHTAAAARVSNQ